MGDEHRTNVKQQDECCRIIDECFAAFKLKKGKWVPCTLRVTNTAVERLDNMLTVLWRARYVDMKSPGAPPRHVSTCMHVYMSTDRTEECICLCWVVCAIATT